ncbi:MAG: hypothetical protein JXM79_00045 [Sedimentisphaerales bacterium]|nr:hypothetical protein [Sedimentisphaerales bacterium]
MNCPWDCVYVRIQAIQSSPFGQAITISQIGDGAIITIINGVPVPQSLHVKYDSSMISREAFLLPAGSFLFG